MKYRQRFRLKNHHATVIEGMIFSGGILDLEYDKELTRLGVKWEPGGSGSCTVSHSKVDKDGQKWRFGHGSLIGFVVENGVTTDKFHVYPSSELWEPVPEETANEKSSVAKKRYRSKYNKSTVVEGIIWQPRPDMENGQADEHGVTYTYINAKEPRWIYQYTGRGHTFSCISTGTLIGRLVNAPAATDYIGRGEWFEEIHEVPPETQAKYEAMAKGIMADMDEEADKIAAGHYDEPVDVAKLGTTKELGEEDLKVELWTHFATYWKWPKPQTFNDLKDLWHKVVDVAEEYAANRKKEVPAVRPHSLKGLTARLEEYLSGFGTANTDIHSLAHRLAVIATKFGACRFGPVETPKETPFDVINRTTAKSLGLTELSYGGQTPSMQVVEGLLREKIERVWDDETKHGLELKDEMLKIAKRYGRDCVDVARAEWMKTDTRKSNAEQTEELKRKFAGVLAYGAGTQSTERITERLMDLAGTWAGGIAENHASHVLGLYLNKPTALAEVKAIVEQEQKDLSENVILGGQANAKPETWYANEEQATMNLWADLKILCDKYGDKPEFKGFRDKMISTCQRWVYREVDRRRAGDFIPPMQVVILDTPENRAAVEEIRKILREDINAVIPSLTPDPSDDVSLPAETFHWVNQASEGIRNAVDTFLGVVQRNIDMGRAVKAQADLGPFLDVEKAIANLKQAMPNMSPEQELQARELHAGFNRIMKPMSTAELYPKGGAPEFLKPAKS